MTIAARRPGHWAWRHGELPPECPPCLNKTVRCAGGHAVGKLVDLVIDDATGRVLFAVICFGSMPRVGDDCRVVPFEACRHDPSSDCITVSLARETLRDAPIYLPDHDAMDDDWWVRVDAYYQAHRS